MTLQFGVSLTDNNSIIIYNCIVFMLPATGQQWYAQAYFDIASNINENTFKASTPAAIFLVMCDPSMKAL
jgi:hypothetical protein